MSEEIVINGNSVAAEVQEADASGSEYIIIRTTGEPLNKAKKTELKKLGVEIQEFVGNEDQQLYLCGYLKTSLSAIRALDYIDYANVYSQNFVIPGVVQIANAQAASTVEVDVLLHHDIGEVDQELIARISNVAAVSESAISVEPGMVRIQVDAEALGKIAGLDEVRVIHPVIERALFTNVARRLLGFQETVVNDTVYKGQGQIVCVADTGFDIGSTTDVHDAFYGRVKQLYSWGRPKDHIADDPDGHGTHVCGSVLGRGQHSSQGSVDGTAPAASLILQSMFVRFNYAAQSILGGYPKNLGDLFQQAYDAGARIHTNSWGTPLPVTNIQRPYDTSAESIDRFIWEHQDMTILFAAGNEGQDTDLDGHVNERSLGAEASAKNCITVGASESFRPDLMSGKTRTPYTYGNFWPNKYTRNPLRDDHQADNPEGLAAFSSRGPTAENRLKPDVVAPGTAILSTKSRQKKYLNSVDKTGVSDDGRYLYLSGTSMSTPLVAGCCAVIREALVKNGYNEEEEGIKKPTGSLIKALIINGAVPIKGQYMPDEHEPNPHSGFGRVNIAATIAMVVPTSDFSGYGVGVINEETEEPFILRISIPSSDDNIWAFKVTMTYADLPGAALSNDLNLMVIAGEKERHGNQVNQEFDVGSEKPFDRRNNVEQVIWPGVSGDSVQVIIKHYRLLSPRVPFAYAWKFF